MARQKIFISYSHKDSKAREQLERFLKTLERHAAIDWWADTRIEGGDDWKADIDRALEEATAAVLLISQDFLASSFIATDEVPRILARHAAGELVVLPVFLSPSTVDLDEFVFVDPRTGAGRNRKLDSFQGYGTPAKPLSDLSWSDQDRVYTSLSRRLRELAQPTRGSAAETARSPAAASTNIADLEAQHNEARRLARLLVSEIKLYNEDAIEEGKRDGNIYEHLKEDIDRSRKRYEDRVVGQFE